MLLCKLVYYFIVVLWLSQLPAESTCDCMGYQYLLSVLYL